MCLSKAYMEKEKGEELLFDDIASIEVREESLKFSTILGEEYEIEGGIKSIDFVENRIVLERK